MTLQWWKVPKNYVQTCKYDSLSFHGICVNMYFLRQGRVRNWSAERMKMRNCVYFHFALANIWIIDARQISSKRKQSFLITKKSSNYCWISFKFRNRKFKTWKMKIWNIVICSKLKDDFQKRLLHEYILYNTRV